MSDRGTRSWRRNYDKVEEEAEDQDELISPGVDQQQDHDEETTTKEEAAAAAASMMRSPAAARWRATKGVGLVIGGLVVLAVLLATTTTPSTWWWPRLDYSSSSSSSSSSPFLVGNNVGRRERDYGERRPPHGPHGGRRIPIPLSCGNMSEQVISPSPSVSMAPAPSPAASSFHQTGSGSGEGGGGGGGGSGDAEMCPDYFRFIHSDLAPWRERERGRERGISREAVESVRDRAAFRLTVVGGRAFVETYHRVFQTRDTFTQWGIAQLLARYPGRLPDLDLMFNCEDMPEIPSSSNHHRPPPLFRYCKDDSTADIVFPDWSFWGWPEINIRPWAPLLREMARETSRLPWKDREPYAFWKGNPGVSGERQDLLRCNGSSVRVFAQDWDAAVRSGFRDGSSNLARQCGYRYKIFVRGRSWSVSEKYILACDSPVLLVDTPYRDFFSRGLVAGKHYWPIDPKRKCRAIDFAVRWGNEHPEEMQRMARDGSGFAREQLAMDYVYDYMLHLLTEYAKLLTYKPTVPENAVELRPENIACPSPPTVAGREREFDFMMQSRERYVADYQPCKLPPPFTADELREMARVEKQVRRNVNSMMRAHN